MLNFVPFKQKFILIRRACNVAKGTRPVINRAQIVLTIKFLLGYLNIRKTMQLLNFYSQTELQMRFL